MDEPEPPLTAGALRAIARYQGHALIAVGCQSLVLLVGSVLVAAAGNWEPTTWQRLMLLVAAVLAATVIQGAAFALLLGARASGVGTGLLLGSLSVVPLIGLAAVLGACAAGTRVLRDHGVRVGPLGVGAAELAALDERVRPGVVEDEGW